MFTFLVVLVVVGYVAVSLSKLAAKLSTHEGATQLGHGLWKWLSKK